MQQIFDREPELDFLKMTEIWKTQVIVFVYQDIALYNYDRHGLVRSPHPFPLSVRQNYDIPEPG